MSHIDDVLSAHFARVSPTADLEARLAAQLAAEREREARRDRAALLREALAAHERAHTRARREQRDAILAVLALALAALGAVALTHPFWSVLGQQLARASTHAGTASGNAAAFTALAFGVVAIALRRQAARVLGL